ncbi:MAG: efflux RND transporter periplasmic adaptor subunit [Spirochaetaceae bacterium]
MRTVSLVVLMTVGAVLVTSCGASEGDTSRENGASSATPEGIAEAEQDEQRWVRGAEVAWTSTADPIRTSGTIRGAREATVVSETQGVIEELSFELGQEVDRGDVLVALDAETERLQMEQAERRMEAAELELRATERLAERGSSSPAELARVRASTAGARAEYERAHKQFRDRRITAPVAGRIAAKNRAVGVGNYLSPNLEIGRIVDLDTLELEVSVGEGEISYLREGAPATVRIPSCPDLEPQTAVVASVAAGSDPETGSFSVLLRWDNECGERVRSGMTATATIEPAEAERVLVVPSSAVVEASGANYVFLADDGVARRREVEIGRRLGSVSEVTEGLSESDVVIITATSRLRDGDAVTVELGEEQESEESR